MYKKPPVGGFSSLELNETKSEIKLDDLGSALLLDQRSKDDSRKVNTWAPESQKSYEDEEEDLNAENYVLAELIGKKLPEKGVVVSNPHICGICCGQVKTTYGLAYNCEHTFCYGCLVEWRYRKKNKDLCFFCPVCQQEIELVIPTERFTKDPKEKAKLLEKYIEVLVKRSCAFPSAGRLCPMGTNCFFKHEIPQFNRKVTF